MNKASKLPTDHFVEIIEQSIDVLVELSDKLKDQSDHTRYRQLKTTQSKEALIDLVFIPIRIYLKGPFVPLDESEENLKNAYSEYCAQLRGFVLEDLTQHLPGSGVPDKLDEILEEVFGIMGKTMFNPKESKHDALFEELCNCLNAASEEMRVRIGKSNGLMPETQNHERVTKGYSKSSHRGSTYGGVTVCDSGDTFIINGKRFKFRGEKIWGVLDKLIDAHFSGSWANITNEELKQFTSAAGKELKKNHLERKAYSGPKKGNCKYSHEVRLK